MQGWRIITPQMLPNFYAFVADLPSGRVAGVFPASALTTKFFGTNQPASKPIPIPTNTTTTPTQSPTIKAPAARTRHQAKWKRANLCILKETKR